MSKKLPDCAPEWVKDIVEHAESAGPVRRDTTDIDWKVEQKLARVLAEKDRYMDGFYYGFFIAALVAYAVWIIYGKEEK